MGHPTSRMIKGVGYRDEASLTPAPPPSQVKSSGQKASEVMTVQQRVASVYRLSFPKTP